MNRALTSPYNKNSEYEHAQTQDSYSHKGRSVLIEGAGVIGSFKAARLREAGLGVTLLARGRGLADLRERGIVLEDFFTGATRLTRFHW